MPRLPAHTDDPPSVVAARQLAEEARHGPAPGRPRRRRPAAGVPTAHRGRPADAPAAGRDGEPGYRTGPPAG
jgi:hypothetical protein